MSFEFLRSIGASGWPETWLTNLAEIQKKLFTKATYFKLNFDPKLLNSGKKSYNCVEIFKKIVQCS